MKLREWLSDSSKKLSFNECIYIVRALFEIESLDMDITLPFVAQKALNATLELRLQNIPLAKIVQKKHFREHCFITNEHTLDPRPETEMLLDMITIKPRSILELGVGTGCIILSAMKTFPKAHGLGVDISPEALEIATLNAHVLRVKKIELKQNNWANGVAGHFDLIFANPPYVDKNAALSSETLHDPALALFGNADTYEEMFTSMCEISFYEMLVEVPGNLVAPVQAMLEKQIIKADKFMFVPIFDSQIFILKIDNTRDF